MHIPQDKFSDTKAISVMTAFSFFPGRTNHKGNIC